MVISQTSKPGNRESPSCHTTFNYKKLMVSPPDVTRDAQAVAKQIVLVFPT